MRHYDVAMVLIRQGDRYHLQLRSGANQSGAKGLVGCFGGAIEPSEESTVAACRELAEESNLQLKPEDLKPLGEVDVHSEKHGQPATIHAHVYLAQVAPEVKIKAIEGELVSWKFNQILANQERLTPATRKCVTTLNIEEI